MKRRKDFQHIITIKEKFARQKIRDNYKKFRYWRSKNANKWIPEIFNDRL